ncbi:MAG: ADP-glyceromanno-heptose 6-epimerase [Proteobacteria bacterium]|nr:ADP-glyceromanno-heptose 6-epimerase [Pseudomonadota bacterium]
MIAVTGAAGFVGSHLVRALNERGRGQVLAVDDLARGRQFRNLADCEILDLLEPEEFLDQLESGALGRVEAVLHQGACTDTMEWDGRRMLRANYAYSKRLLGLCDAQRIPLIYASSAAVYGTGREFRIDPACERPVNLYAYSKLLFDRHLRQRRAKLRCPVVGLRYFNVYGPREQHKGRMASIVYQLYRQLQAGSRLRLFGEYGGCAPGEQRRDFVWVGDVAAVNLWFLEHPEHSGLFNLGTGRAQSFNEVAQALIAHAGRGEIEYRDFPEELVGRYQVFTCADLSELRAAGYTAPFLSVQEGVPRYLSWLEKHGGEEDSAGTEPSAT